MFTSICTVEYVRDNDIRPGTRNILTLCTPPVLKATVTVVGGGGVDVEELDICEYES